MADLILFNGTVSVEKSPTTNYSRPMQRIAKIISGLCHPIFVPLLAVLCFFFCSPFSLIHTSTAYRWVVIGMTAISTILLPVSAWIYMRYQGKWIDLFVVKQGERWLLYLISLVSYLTWIFMLRQAHATPLMVAAMSAFLINLLVMLVNFRWKISAHAASSGGVFGVVCGMSYSFYMNSPLVLCVLLLLSLSVLLSRLILQAHTPWQVVAGFYLGATVAFSVVTLYYAFL